MPPPRRRPRLRQPRELDDVTVPASGADQPTLRDQLLDDLSSWFHANVCPHIDDESDTWGGETCDDYAVALLPVIEAHMARAKAEGGAEALEQAADWLDKDAPDTTSADISWEHDVEDEDTAMAWCQSSIRDRAASLRAASRGETGR